MNIAVNRERLQSEIDMLALISDAEAPAVTRIVFSETDAKAHALLKDLCHASGLLVREDAIGNTFARWVGSEPGLPAVGTGSHIDAVPNAGKYDGVVGVLGGLEAIRALQKCAFRPKHSIELLVFTSEEPTRFGVGCLGSRMLSGVLSPASARELKDSDGVSLDQARQRVGHSGTLDSVELPTGYYKAFIELHIEQGPILEQHQITIGVVGSIAAPASLRISIEGCGGHAGGVLMPDRRDALCAAAELILAVENAAKMSGGVDTVATVGICDVFPGAVNSIPSLVRLSVDIRDIDHARRDYALQLVESARQSIAGKRDVSIEAVLLNADMPAVCDPQVVAALKEACNKRNIPFLPIVSRAYHDSLFMSQIAPTAMLFIPCHNGYSHRPDEYASPEDIERGTLVLAEALADLAS